MSVSNQNPNINPNNSFEDVHKTVASATKSILNKAAEDMAQSGKSYMTLPGSPSATIQKTRVRFAEQKDAQILTEYAEALKKGNGELAKQKSKELQTAFEKGSVFYETKDKSGHKTQFATAPIAQQLKTGGIQIRGKKGNLKQFNNVQIITKQQQANVATAFAKIFFGPGVFEEQKKSATKQIDLDQSDVRDTSSYKAPTLSAVEKPKQKVVQEKQKPERYAPDSRKARLDQENAIKEKRKFWKTENEKDEKSQLIRDQEKRREIQKKEI